MSNQEAPLDQQRDAVARLFAQHQRWLFGYLVTLVGNPQDAEDVFQEVCVVIWREYKKFEIGTNFVSWVSVIAYHQAQKLWRTRRKSHQMLALSSLEAIAEEAVESSDLLDARRDALAGCLAKLRESDRQIIHRYYSENRVTADVVAEQLGRPVNTVYKALNRIRKTLHTCIDKSVAAQGWN